MVLTNRRDPIGQPVFRNAVRDLAGGVFGLLTSTSAPVDTARNIEAMLAAPAWAAASPPDGSSTGSDTGTFWSTSFASNKGLLTGFASTWVAPNACA